jgi:sterol desaturase/sphingolipid hydroxylase (fatty acid hydroxylase superfamily)
VYAFTFSSLPAYLIGILFVSGFLIFTLIEYFVHRYVFHMEPDTEIKEKIQYNFHGVHHEYPKDKGRLAMPPVLSVLLAAILLYVFHFVIGEYTFAFLPGFVMGYASYLFVHYAVHAYQPPKNFLKILWINHSIHHYKDHNKAFGVSSPLWDFVFRTLP